MNSERVVRIMAGSFILRSLRFGAPASPLHHCGHWLWLTAFVGFNPFQSGFTHFCPAEMIRWKLGVKKASARTGCLA
jgi:hypothetical protein